jgi:hypothetical protein
VKKALARSKSEDRVKELREKFAELRAAFTAERIVHVELSVLRVVDGVDQLQSTLKDHSMLLLLELLHFSYFRSH